MTSSSREVRQYVVTTPGSTIDTADGLPQLSLYQADGSPYNSGTEIMPLQADVAALTSSAAAGSTPTKAEYDALRTDVAAVRTAVNSLLAKLKTAGFMATS